MKSLFLTYTLIFLPIRLRKTQLNNLDTQKERRKEINVDYKNMTESERNELIAYTAGMAAYLNEQSKVFVKVMPYLLILLILNLCAGIMTLAMLIMN